MVNTPSPNTANNASIAGDMPGLGLGDLPGWDCLRFPGLLSGDGDCISARGEIFSGSTAPPGSRLLQPDLLAPAESEKQCKFVAGN